MIGAAALRALIVHHPSRPLRDTYFRAMGLRHHADPLGRGRPIARQRFNVENGARILYVGDDPITCLHEVQAFGFPVTSIAVVPVQLELNAVLDLRDAALRHALAITEEDVAFNSRAEPRSSPRRTWSDSAKRSRPAAAWTACCTSRWPARGAPVSRSSRRAWPPSAPRSRSVTRRMRSAIDFRRRPERPGRSFERGPR